MIDVATRFEVENLYAAYTSALDDGRFEDWPELFVEDGSYTLIPRENHDRGLPLATMMLESRGMMKDRVYGVVNTLFHAPYYQRHILGPMLIAAQGEVLIVEVNYVVFRTKRNAMSEVFNTGRYLDRVVRTDEGLRFAEKICVFDSEMIPNSIIYPV